MEGGVPKGRPASPSLKVISMAQAIERFVPDGASVALGVALEPLIPFAAGHEMIRQGRRDLELVGPISDTLFDQLIGAGCARRVTAAWVGNVSEGLGHCYRRACEQGVPRSLEVHVVRSILLWRTARRCLHIRSQRPLPMRSVMRMPIPLARSWDTMR